MSGSGIVGLLEPGSGGGYAVAGDGAFLSAIVQAEQAWLDVLVTAGAAPAGLPHQLATSLEQAPLDLASIADRSAAGGNPVIPVVDDLRSRLGDGGRCLHRGLTSQDVLDTAIMLVARAALARIDSSLRSLGSALAAQAEAHRGTVMVGRTLTQHAVPVTFGLKAAQWLSSVDELLGEVEDVQTGLPLQCGGAAGTLAGVQVVAGGDPLVLAQQWADLLGLRWPGAPWHTRRRPVTRLGDLLAAVASALGHLGTDLATLSRPELGEVSEGLAPGHGRSSTMPDKRNPIGSVLIRAAGIQAGPLAGLLHQCAALAVDERPDGSWHAEWPTVQRLLVLGVSAAQQAATVLEGLVVHADVMGARVANAGPHLVAERAALTGTADSSSSAADYLGASGPLTERAVRAWRERETR